MIGAFIVNLSTSVMFLALLMNDYTVAAFIAGYAFSVPYNIMVAVGVWRSANRYEGEKRWADLARIVTVAAMVILESDLTAR